MVHKINLRVILAVLVICLGSFFVLADLASGGSLALNSTILRIDPSNLSIPISSSRDVIVRLENVSNVYGAQIEINFDPANLAVVDADPVKNGIQIQPGTCPQPDFIVLNSVVAGKIEYAATQISPTSPCNGGNVAIITFQCLQARTVNQVDFGPSLISDPDGLPISYTSQSATIVCDYLNYLPVVVR